MSENNYIDLQKVVHTRQAMVEYQDMVYLNLMQQVNTKCKEILTDDMGSQFVSNCCRDLAGEVVRNYFDTSEYYLTVDQFARRIMNFSYEDEYDPLAGGGEIAKNVLNYDDKLSSRLDGIVKDLDSSQEALFPKSQVTMPDGKGKLKYDDESLMQKGKKEYVESRTREDGFIIDEYTGQVGEYITDKNGNRIRRQEVDHVQAAHTAKYNKDLIKEAGVEELKKMMNSEHNFAMMDKVANTSKGDVKVYEKNGDTVIDITHRATPEQLAEAICKRWEGTSGKTKQELIDKGYLSEDGTVSKSVKNTLISNLRHSQNEESKVILKYTDYGKVGQKALDSSFRKRNEDGTYGKFSLNSAFGKILVGQILYYAVPPVVYEIKAIAKDKSNKLDNALDKLVEAGKRIGNYVFSKLKDIIKNVSVNTLKNLIKSFMDILINMVKATIKKMLQLVKRVVLATVDAIRIIADPNATAAEKADSVFNLFGVTIANFAVEVLFEFIEKGLHLPRFLCNPLRIITSVICTNLTMLVLQKADLFDVRFGFKIKAINELFANMRMEYQQECEAAGTYADYIIQELIKQAREEGKEIYNRLMECNPKTDSVESDLNRVNKMFRMNINFDEEWLKFIGLST